MPSASVPARPHGALPAELAGLADDFIASLDVGPPVADCCGETLHDALRREGKKQSAALSDALLRPDAEGDGTLHRLARKPGSRGPSALQCVLRFVGPHLTAADFSALALAADAHGARPAQIAARRGDSLLAAQLKAIEELRPKKDLSAWPWGAAQKPRAAATLPARAPEASPAISTPAQEPLARHRSRRSAHA